MYENVGGKIQIISQVFGLLSLIAGVGAWFVICICLGNMDNFLGWMCLIAGGFGLVSSWFVYAFGQIVEDVHYIREKKEQ